MEKPKIKLLVGTPAAGAKVGTEYFRCALDTQRTLDAAGIPAAFACITGAWTAECRNALASYLLTSEFTHLLFVDSDMIWNAQDVIRLLAQDVPIIGALYPRKSINVEGALAAAKEVPDLDLATFRHILLRRTWTVTPVAEAGDVSHGTETRRAVDWMPTGFLLLRRDALEKIRPLCTRYTSVSGPTCFDFFRYDLRKNDAGNDPDRCGEDRSFGDLARSAGLAVWQLLNVELGHTGEVTF